MFFTNTNNGNLQFVYYLITIFLVFLGVLAGNIPMSMILIQRGDLEEGMNTADIMKNMTGQWDLAYMLIPFAVGLLVLFFCNQVFHKRPTKDLITGHRNIRWNRAVGAFVGFLALTGIMELISYFMSPENYSITFDAASFLPLLLIALTLLVAQTSFEEIFMRGYLMQGIGRLFKNRAVPLIVTSLIFGVMHIANPEVASYGIWQMMTYYIGIGLFLGVITIMDDGLELALGIHAATNFYAAAIVSYPDSALNTKSIFSNSVLDIDGSLISWGIMIVVILIFLKWFLKWGSWSKLFSNIDYDNNEKFIDNEIV